MMNLYKEKVFLYQLRPKQYIVKKRYFQISRNIDLKTSNKVVKAKGHFSYI